MEKLQSKPNHQVLLLVEQGCERSELVQRLQLCCHLAQIPTSHTVSTLEEIAAWGPAAPKLPSQSLQLTEPVWAVTTVQTMEAWLGSCHCFWRASDRLGSDYPNPPFTL